MMKPEMWTGPRWIATIGWAMPLIALLFAVTPPAVKGDVYMYTDGEGVLHFTNVPTSSRYRLYLKEPSPGNGRGTDSTAYDAYIREASEKHGLSFALLKSVIRAESDFNPKAVSRKGALGLMQLMPQNAKSLKVRDPFDPKENIMAGAGFLKRMIDRFEGKLQLGLAAYNAGPDAVDRYKRIPPFPETENYVKKVMKFYQAYR